MLAPWWMTTPPFGMEIGPYVTSRVPLILKGATGRPDKINLYDRKLLNKTEFYWHFRFKEGCYILN